jgi:hypothetical protein
MKLNNLIFVVVLIGITACNPENKYIPEKNLSDLQQKQILYTTIRYLGHLPKKGSHENKFDPQFDEYYRKLVLDYTLEAYYKNNDEEYFLVSRIAPSLQLKKVALGVKMKRDGDGKLLYYEEVFRTWKFEIPEMKEKGLLLFNKMIKGEDLRPYYPQNSGAEEFIEFPDEKVYYDVNERRWITAGSMVEIQG